MRHKRSWRRTAAAIGVVALVVAACGNGDDDAAEPDPETEEPAVEPDDDADDEEPADDPADEGEDDGEAAADIAYDVGVTEEPCPDAVNEDNGCIYLGILSDLSVGPFAALAVPITAGQRAFWQRVNEDGGIGGFDVNIDEYTRDTEYNPEQHAAAYRQIEPDILAIAQTLGTETTEAILGEMDEDNVVGSPASWWSGWHHDSADLGLILESGYSYCLESMIGLDWHTENRSAPESILAVGYPGDYGGDAAVGAEAWAEANDAEFVGFVQTAPNAIVGSQDEAVGQVVGSGADVVVLAVGPAETAEIVGGSAANDFQGAFLGSIPTWNHALLDSPAGPALQAFYTLVAPWENFEGESDAHAAMQEALGGDLPDNDGFTYGWIWSYPMKALLEAAADNGDLTREGVRAAVDGLQVDYEGALPTASFGGDANADALRVGVIGQPDPDAQLGITTVETGVTGPTVEAYDYSAPCVGG